jgi:glycosyltransferase involved in cell wall biosynthesis
LTNSDISIIIPLLNEEGSLKEMSNWIDTVMKREQLSYEVLFIDDGSSDQSWFFIQEITKTNPFVKGIKFRRNYGKSAALNEGFLAATGKVVITMDADLQDSPEEIPEMNRMILQDGFDMVSGWKKKRHDPLSKTIPTKLYNSVTQMVSGIKLHDFNCGLKAYRLNVVKNLEVYGEMHRYIPVLAKKEGFVKIGEKVVQHQARKYGKSKFGMERFVNGFLDLMTVSFISKFGKKPMHFFGVLGMLTFFVGFIAFFWIGGSKIYHIINQMPARNIADTSQFYIALTAMIIGTQFFLTGFIAELVSRNSSVRNHYKIDEKINLE